MKANSFQDKEAETEGKDVIPNKMAKTNDKTPEKDYSLFLSWLDLVGWTPWDQIKLMKSTISQHF